MSSGETEFEDSNTIKHAKREFVAMGYIPLDEPQEDGPNKWMQESVLELLKVFSGQGHSGFSAPHCIDLFKKLASFEPLGPLTGEDWEWGEVSFDPSMKYQNKRCGHIFRGDDGRAYDSQGVVFREPNGSCFTNSDSRVYIEFPYTPSVEYIDVPADR